MIKLFPISLDLTNRLCTIIGGGNIAFRKAKSLEQAGGILRIVAPDICPELIDDFGESCEIRHKQYEPSDLDGSFLVIAATNDKKLNSLIVSHCRKRGILVNAVDQPEDCDFYFPAVIQKNEIQIAISTGGCAPAMAGWLKREIEKSLGDNLDAGLEIVSNARLRMIEMDPGGTDRRAQGFCDFFESDLWKRFLKGEHELLVEEVVEWILSSTG